MYSASKKIATVLILCLLLYLFTVPSIFLTRVVDELQLQAGAARRAVESDEDPGPHFEAMVALMDDSADRFRLFLDHDLVDETLVAVHALSPMTDPEHLFSDLEALEILLDHLKDAEVFSFRSIL